MGVEPVDRLNDAEKKLVLSEVRQELWQEQPSLLAQLDGDVPGGFAELEGNLDALVAIVRRSDAVQVEPYLSQIHDDICSHCAHQEHSAFCSLRYENKCLLYAGAGSIVAAIRRALREIDIEHAIARPGNT